MSDVYKKKWPSIVMYILDKPYEEYIQANEIPRHRVNNEIEDKNPAYERHGISDEHKYLNIQIF